MRRFDPNVRALAFLLPLALVGCGQSSSPDAGPSASSQHAGGTRKVEDPLEKACAASATYDRLKAILFSEARKVRKVASPRLDQLEANAVVRMENPVVASQDDPLTVLSCKGRFIVELPPGFTDAFDGDQRLAADVDYTIQRAADKSGLVYSISRAEPIVYRLAAVDLSHPAAAAEAPAEPPADSPEPTSPAPPAPVVVIRPPAPPVPLQYSARPSYDCRYARTRVERMICGDPRLAALDRQMAQAYEGALDRADRRTARAIVRSREPFLDYRDDCPDPQCVAEAYRDRIDELRDYSVDD